MAVVGAVFMVFVLFFPAGIWGTLVRRIDRKVVDERPCPSLEVTILEGLSKRFGSFVALNNVTARFEPRKLSAIIGPNGAGKSTFFNVVSGAFPPSSRHAEVPGPRHHRAGAARVRAHRHRQELPDHHRVQAAERARERARGRADAPCALPAVQAARSDGRAGRARRRAAGARRPGRPAGAPAADLAHGQQRALEVAMALASEPELLLMDEPTAGMSPEETKVMMDLIVALAAERSVILVEHKMKLVMGICERLLVLHHGEFLAEGTPDEIRANDEVRRVYLGQG
jgi:branched-chain amino acid transport system ATP-binding protein